MEQRTYYAVLGVTPAESSAGIRAAYHDLAKRYHPDVSGDGGTRAFQDIEEAYRVLSDPQRRRRYDDDLARRGEGGRRAAPPTRARPRPEPLHDPVSVMGAPDAIHPSFDAMYDRFLRNFTGVGVPKAERLEGINFDLVLTPAEAAGGGSLEVGVPVFVPCPECAGSGRQWLFPCAACAQQGVLESERPVRIDVPPMIAEGSIIEVPLHGLGIHNFFLRLHVSIGA
jgi:molecular chaperone DnaJ